MSRNKLEKFAEVARFPNVYQIQDFEEDPDLNPRGEWNEQVFENQNPITLELACGKGEYALELARRNPHQNYVGIDIKGDRLWKGAKMALGEGLENVHFLRIYIDHLEQFFAPDEVDEIWITFPDPYPKYSDRNKRLSAPKFLRKYHQILKPEAPIHLKTDNWRLFTFTRRIVKRLECPIDELVDDVHNERPGNPLLSIQTFYEKRHRENGRQIRYIKFRLPHDLEDDASESNATENDSKSD